MSWELWLGIYVAVGLIWGVTENLYYGDYGWLEFFLCAFFWLPRIALWCLLLIYLGVNKLVARTFDWADRWGR